jgi:hypothetical protein
VSLPAVDSREVDAGLVLQTAPDRTHLLSGVAWQGWLGAMRNPTPISSQRAMLEADDHCQPQLNNDTSRNPSFRVWVGTKGQCKPHSWRPTDLASTEPANSVVEG